MAMASSRFANSVAFSFLVLLLAVAVSTDASNVTSDGRGIIIDGKHKLLISGSIHYSRSTAEMWPDLIKKAKEGGLDSIETYVFWNAHEPVRRRYDFNGNLDLVRFIKTIQDAGLYAILRIGPYVCAEWDYGGFPMWLHNLNGIKLRTNNQVFMNEMQTFTTLIVNMMKENKLFASQGGPIILAQIENEYGNVQGSYGDEAKTYIEWCANMANSQDIGVPWLMCQQKDAPRPMINTCNGFYCDQFTPTFPDSPKIWTENWVGWFKSWGGSHPHRPTEDVAFAVARFFQLGGSLNNYYMYHGGTNFGRTSGGPYITTTYDYDAPLDEYGNLNQPKYGHLKNLHDLLHSIETLLTQGNVSSEDLGNSVSVTNFTTEDEACCFISNVNDSSDATVNLNGNEFIVPAWSVSILQNCTREVYNTAKVNVQRSVMVMEPSKIDTETGSLRWSWRPELMMKTAVFGNGDFGMNQILDQKKVAADVSDYLWYITNVDIRRGDPILTSDITLRVNGTGHVLHAYVNGELIGSEWAKYGTFNYVFEAKTRLKLGRNVISLLSATVGFQNYGPHFDEIQSGIVGSVQIIGNSLGGSMTKNLSTNRWIYKVGLEGIVNQFFNPKRSVLAKGWTEIGLPVNRSMTWYKTQFKVPSGNEPIALDLQGMGKGMAWVNGNSIGRYWPTYIAQQDGCSSTCDYRGNYDSSKCQTRCGEPTQRWYHVPRSFFKKGENSLVLFEEFGGNPSTVNFHTVTAGSVCFTAVENKTIELDCGNKAVKNVKFASFGNSQGTCGAFTKGTCDKDSTSYLHKTCVGKAKCSIDVSGHHLGAPNCDKPRRLTLEVQCGK